MRCAGGFGGQGRPVYAGIMALRWFLLVPVRWASPIHTGHSICVSGSDFTREQE